MPTDLVLYPGVMTTLPLGTRIAEPKPWLDNPVTFENFRLTVSNVKPFAEPTLVEALTNDGVKNTFPDPRRHAPSEKVKTLVLAEGIVTFEEMPRLGLMTIMLDLLGVPMTFPLGARVRPVNPSVPTKMFEEPRPTGSNWMTLDVPGEGMMTFPLVKS
jgi:hypothetical protein